jgi:ribose-phosphate pyrophosphokinase
MEKKIVFAHHSMENMATDVAAQADAELGSIQWKKFPDTWPKLSIEEAQKVENRDVVFIANLAKPEPLFEQLAIMYALPMHLTRSLNVIVPFFPVGTMERVSVYGEIATAKSLARMLSAIPGSPIITIFDIHALQNQFYFDDNRVRPKLISAIPFLLNRLRGMPMDYVAIAFPDDGAYKRFGAMFPGYPKIICNKVRMPDGTKVVTIKEGDPSGMYVIIVDDLIQTGGTLIECRNALIAGGALKVSAYATHGVFPEQSEKKFTADLFDKVWITDSCFQGVVVEPFEILPLAPLIAFLL